MIGARAIVMALVASAPSLALASAVSAERDPIFEALSVEIERAMEALAGQPDAPYFMAVEVTDTHSLHLSAEDGALHGYGPRHNRRVDADVRLGGPELDSTHPLRSGRDEPVRMGRDLPLTDDVALLRRGIWRELDQRVQKARSRWAKVKSDRAVLVEEEEGLDLAPVDPVVHAEPLVTLDLDPGPWEDVLRRASAVLGQDGVVRDGQVSLSATAENFWLVTSEGTRVRHGRVEYQIAAHADTIADDGTALRLNRRWSGHTLDALPDEETLIAAVHDLHQQLADLRDAPDQEPYRGPVLLTDKAAGVFFHEIFGHRMEGHRLKRVDNAQTFRSLVGQAILPDFLTVFDDPTLPDYQGIDLRGHYLFDNEGVAAQRAMLVEDGVLKGFLQSRSVTTVDDRSNGHGRRQAGRLAVTRQGNLIVEASERKTNAALRQALIERAKAEGLAYGLLLDDIQGGFTFTSRGMPNAFNVDVLVAWRVYTDGRPDELVRGIDLIGTPLQAFQRIVAAGETTTVFNGACGAESGWVPVSAVAPWLLVSELETQRKTKAQQTPPLLPAPMEAP